MSLKLERDLAPNCKNQVTRAKTAAQSKNYDYAISLLQAALKEEPLFLEGRRYLRVVEIQKYNALSAFNKQMLNMKVASAAMKLGGGKKEPAEQLAAAEEVLALDPFNTKANAVVGDAGVALGYLAFKTFAYETLAEGRPNDKAVLNTLAQTYMENREPLKAEQTFERILKFDPRDGDALSGLKNASAAHASSSGGWEREGGDYRNALKSKEESIELEQNSKVVKSAEAIEEQIQANYAKYQAEPSNPAYPKAIARLYEQKNEYASAIPWYEAAFVAGNRIDSSLEKVIGDLKQKSAQQELAQLCEAMATISDEETRAQYLAAISAKEAEMSQLRLEQAEARVRAYPNEGQLHFELGEALYAVGQYKRALSELQIGLKQPNVRYQAMNLMGLSFMKQGMNDLAVKRLSDAANELGVMDEIKKEIVYNLGLAYEATNNHPQALDQFKKIYEVDMAYRDVAQRVEASYG